MMRDVQLMFHIPAAMTVFIGLFLAVAARLKGRFRVENPFFPFVCLLWSLDALFYFIQPLVPVTLSVCMERLHHLLFVWVSLAHIHFVYRWLDLRNDRLERFGLGVTLGLSAASLTPWYVQGVHRYPWGVVADAGPLFYLHVLVCVVTAGYLLRLCRGGMGWAYSVEEQRDLRLAVGSVVSAVVLFTLDLIPLSGFSLYTPGNWLFFPMLTLACALFRDRVSNVCAVVRFLVVGGVAAGLFLAPNFGLLYLIHPFFRAIGPVTLFFFILCWFYLSFRALQVMLPVVHRLQGRQRLDLKKVETHFSENILLLRRTDEMINEFRRTVGETLRIRGMVFFTRKGEGFLEEDTGRALELSEATHRWLSLLQVPLDRREVERRAANQEVRREVVVLLDQCGCGYIVSLSRYGELLGLVLFPKKSARLGLTLGEERFVSRIKEFVSIALYNSTVYQNLSRLQEELSRHTGALVEEAAERKRTQEEAEQSEKRSRLLADNVMETISILSIEPLEFTYLSPSVVKLLGYEEEELIGQCVGIVLTDDSEREIRSVLNHALTSRGGYPRNAFIYETELKRKDGSRVWSELSARFLRDEGGKAREILLVSRDITERRHLEREREALQRKLRQAQKMESIGVLAGGIAHDFNSILMAVMGYTRLAIMYISEENVKAREKIMQIEKAGQRARDLVAQILAFSRRNKQKREPCYLREHLKETVGFLSASLPSTIDVRFTAGEGKLRVVADAVQIHQIIINLATNAFHAIGEGGGAIHVHAEEVTVEENLSLVLHLPEGPYVRLSVSDTGHGVDPEIAPRIFEPYYTTKEVGKGTGMGLAVVHGIVLNHGGAVSLDSERGKGATFHVYLPIVPLDGSGPEGARAVGEAKGTVLLLDDEEILIDLAREVLGRLGYEVEAFTDGQKALEVFAQRPKKYEAVVMDLFTEGVGGVEMVRTVRDHAPGIPLVVTSGRPEPMTRSSLGNVEGAEILLKPFTLKELAEVLGRVIA
ncbi:hybrid sensor histidine kinase/response regulator [Desulfoluna spongiiphila]|nr:ATP-binding protein [Desulfoluna spongiiphila]